MHISEEIQSQPGLARLIMYNHAELQRHARIIIWQRTLGVLVQRDACTSAPFLTAITFIPEKERKQRPTIYLTLGERYVLAPE